VSGQPVSVFSRGPRPGAAPAVPAPRATPSAESPSARRFGDLLVEDGVITSAQLDAALRLQSVARAYVPIGQVLLANKLITRRKLNTMLHRHGKRSRLGEVLIKAGRITVAQLDAALAMQRKTPIPIGQALIRMGYLNETTMRDALCTQLHVNFFDLDPIKIDQKLTAMVSERYATRHLLLPLFRVHDILVVAMDDPSETQLVERLEFTLGLQIEVVTTTTEKLKAAMRRLYGPPLAHEVDVFAQRNILIGPVRDHLVVELVERGLRGVSVLSFG
jgi:hypothetical protein